jgi:putative ABC transport system permease protein
LRGYAALTSGALTGVLQGVTALDPMSYAMAVSALAIVAAIASGLPTRRAASVDPIRALRK